MRVLVVGAGGVGGYFGGRLLAAGRPVTFLVRSRRAEQLARTGLVIKSPLGDLALPAPPTIAAEALAEPFDLILLSCKAYDVESAMDAFAPAVGAGTAVLPLLNGMRHLDLLEARFGPQAVLGGKCVISAALDGEGRILHLGTLHGLSFGTRSGAVTPEAQAIAQTLAGAGFEATLTTRIMQEMWEKWGFIATGAGINCLMRGTIGDIVAAGANDVTLALLAECAAVATKAGHPPSQATLDWSRGLLTAEGSPFIASMFRDILNGARIEADHVIGDLLHRAGDLPTPTLRIVFAHLKTYEAKRAREEGQG